MAKQIIYTRTKELAPYQLEIIDCEERFAVVEASTKSGKTTLCIVWLLEEALRCKENQSVFWVAPFFTQALIAFNRMKEKIDDRTFFKVNETRMTLTLPHGAIIAFKSADNPDTLYGDDCYAAVIDEASRMKEDSWVAIRTTLTKTEGKCKIIGNVKGRHNFFYLMARDAKDGKNGFFYKKITCYDAAAAGIISYKEIEEAKAQMSEDRFKELWLAEPSEDGGNPFGFRYIDQCTFPISEHPAIGFGIDLGKAIDYTVIVGLDKNGSVCFFERFKKDWHQTMQTIANLPKVPIKIDATGVGDPIVEELQRLRPNVEAFKFTQNSKQQIIEGLAVGIQQRKITFPEGYIKTELELFEYEHTATGVKYSSPSGKHDDCVCALALAYDLHKKAVHSGSYSWM